MNAAADVLTCPDAELAERVGKWLDEGRLPLPEAFRWIVHRTEDAGPPWTELRTPHLQPGLRIFAGELGSPVRVETERPFGWAEVHPSLPVAEVWLRPEGLEHFEVLERSFLLVVLIFALRRAGMHHVHGAAFQDPTGQGWVLLGTSHMGKSTTTALLASRGWSLTTDDIGFLEPVGERVAVRGWRSPIALRPGGKQLLGAAGGIPLLRRQKAGFWPEELGAQWIEHVTPTRLVFPTVGEAPTQLRPITQRAAIQQAMMSSTWLFYESLEAQRHLDLLGQLVRQCTCYDATFAPDLFDAPNALQDFLP